MFRSLRPRLAVVLPSDAVIEHVGATAVSGCLTKGDLDISVQVDPQAFAAADLALSGLFERNAGSVRTDSFSAFKCDAYGHRSESSWWCAGRRLMYSSGSGTGCGPTRH